MKIEQVFADFEGFVIQYSSNLKAPGLLTAVYSNNKLDEEKIKQVARKLTSKVSFTKPITSDGYEWMLGVEFNSETARLAVLFPYLSKQNGYLPHPQRQVGVYTNKNLRREYVEEALRRFAVELSLSRK